MIQTIENRRYANLLEERVATGRLYVDAVCHGGDFAEAEVLFRRIEELDTALCRFGRFSAEDRRRVQFAEDARWHVPGEPPAEDPFCSHCARGDLGLLDDVVLLAETRSWWGEAA